MLAYPIEEAEALLESKLSGAKHNLANCEEDLDFLREQITVCSVAGTHAPYKADRCRHSRLRRLGFTTGI